MKKEEQLLEMLEQIKVPQDALKQARFLAINRRKREKRQQKRMLQLGLSAALIFLALTLSIRLSPQIAEAAAKIPLLAPFVEIITYDKGMKDILANDYAQNIIVQDEQSGKKFTITSVVADETGLLIAYRFENNEAITRSAEFKEVKLMQNGEALPAGVTMHFNGSEDKTVMESTLDFIFVENRKPYGNDFELVVQLNDTQETTFTLPFSLSKQLAPSKQYVINKQLVVDGQEILVNSVYISPLRVEASFTIPETNTKRILDFDLRLVDETGEEWGRMSSGTTGFGSMKDGEFTRFIQSNYFREPKSLTLIIENIEALDKGQDYIEVDFSKKQVLYVPEKLDVKLEIPTEASIHAVYPLAKAEHSKPLLQTLIDANGKEWWSTQSSSLFGDRKESESSYMFEKGFANPVKMYIQNYPLFLNGSGQIEISIRE
ncbi:DUF4179 domain-containing protein [Bacillus ndiopicus]|uniref:DUF4179 domain-containing protein n=1 Tax=Bacillus ndiopicus TaxID=1347368 RepID=UPI0005A8CDB0|nr:DUF4179 domain-containing protein [Bacillus ndiopicus]